MMRFLPLPPPKGVRVTTRPSRIGAGTFWCREDFDLLGQVVAEKRRRLRRAVQ
jgi:hypothetical protein